MVDPKIKAHFQKRTKRHISLVQKYCGRLAKAFPEIKGLVARGLIHDASKFKTPEIDPYIWLTWRYKCEADGTDPQLPDGMTAKINKVTKHHIQNNAHHPEFHTKRKEGLVARGDRDGVPSKIVSGAKMKDLDLAEMVADWCAMSEELGNSPKTWADKVIGTRYNFKPEQVTFIHKLIRGVWTGNKKKQKTAGESPKPMSFSEGLLLGALSDDPSSNPYIWKRLNKENAMKKTASQIADVVLGKLAAYTDDDAAEDQQVDSEYMANNQDTSMGGGAPLSMLGGAGLGAMGGGAYHYQPGAKNRDAISGMKGYTKDLSKLESRVANPLKDTMIKTKRLGPVSSYLDAHRLKGLVKRLGIGAAVGGGLGLGAYGLHKAFGGGEEPTAKEASSTSTCSIADKVLAKLR